MSADVAHHVRPPNLRSSVVICGQISEALPRFFSVPSALPPVNNRLRMFTSRFTWSLDANPLSLALRAPREAALPVIDLTAANPPKLPPPPHPDTPTPPH